MDCVSVVCILIYALHTAQVLRMPIDDLDPMMTEDFNQEVRRGLWLYRDVLDCCESVLYCALRLYRPVVRISLTEEGLRYSSEPRLAMLECEDGE